MPLTAPLEVQPSVGLFREPSDESGLEENSPPWLAVKSPLSVFLVQFTYNIYCALLYIPAQFSSLFMFIQIRQFKGSTVLFDHFPIIIQLLSRFLILEIYSRYFDPIKKY